MEGGIYLLLGSNLGDRLKNLEEAKDQIGGVKVCSAVYVTAAWGNEDQPEFYNQVIEVATRLSPEELLEKILSVEKEIGRTRSEKWGPRVIDIDILFYGDKVIKSSNLIVPHPELQNRKFTLVPLDELAPLFIHPVFGKTIHQLLEECIDSLAVTRLQR